MKRRLSVLVPFLLVAAFVSGCQHPKSKMTETRSVDFAVDPDTGLGTGEIATTNREILPDGRTNEVTVAITNAIAYAETAESRADSLSFFSKQDASNLATDRRTSMGGRLKTGLGSYSGSVQPDAISAVAGPVSDALKAYLAMIAGGPAGAAAKAVLSGDAQSEDYDSILADLDAKRAEVEKLRNTQ